MSNVATLDHNPAVASDGSFKVGNFNKGQMRGDLSSQWNSRPDDERFVSLDALHASTLERAEQSWSEIIPAAQVFASTPTIQSAADLKSMSLRVELPRREPVDLDPTHWSFGQLAGLIKAPAAYLRSLPSPLTADLINWGTRAVRTEQIKVYGQTNGVASLRAINGPDYGRVCDHEVVDAVRRIAGNGNGDTEWRVPGSMSWGDMTYRPTDVVTRENTTLYASDRDVWMFLVNDRNPIEVGKLPSGEPDLMFRGFYVWNSEVGARSLGIATFYLRSICCNRLMWGVEKYQTMTIRHSKNAEARFIDEVRPALANFADHRTDLLIEGVAAAKAATIAKEDDDAIEFLRARKFSVSRAKQVLEAVEREEGHPARSIWDIAQGLTAVARDIPHTDDRVTMERQAGAILDMVKTAA